MYEFNSNLLQDLYICSKFSDDSGILGIEYASGADRLFVWDSSGISARTDYNGVLLLHTALQQPLPSAYPDKVIYLELVLSEV